VTTNDNNRSQSDIAAAAGLTRQTIERMERSGSQPVVSRDATVGAVVAALGAKGVVFVPHGVVLAGVRLNFRK
jgi:transcriptional regulator with XRE-family HTH domain